MKKLLVPFLVIGLLYSYFQNQAVEPSSVDRAVPQAPAAAAQANWQSGDQARGNGTVSRILSDDNDGSRHQRFIVRLASGRTLLIAHNIDLAPRVQSLQVGDSISFNGQYEWNERGGVIHWTHHDPQGRHVGGWLEHNGSRYE